VRSDYAPFSLLASGLMWSRIKINRGLEQARSTAIIANRLIASAGPLQQAGHVHRRLCDPAW
jgi:hypothetical protein